MACLFCAVCSVCSVFKIHRTRKTTCRSRCARVKLYCVRTKHKLSEPILLTFCYSFPFFCRIIFIRKSFRAMAKWCRYPSYIFHFSLSSTERSQSFRLPWYPMYKTVSIPCGCFFCCCCYTRSPHAITGYVSHRPFVIKKYKTFFVSPTVPLLIPCTIRPNFWFFGQFSDISSLNITIVCSSRIRTNHFVCHCILANIFWNGLHGCGQKQNFILQMQKFQTKMSFVIAHRNSSPLQ